MFEEETTKEEEEEEALTLTVAAQPRMFQWWSLLEAGPAAVESRPLGNLSPHLLAVPLTRRLSVRFESDSSTCGGASLTARSKAMMWLLVDCSN